MVPWKPSLKSSPVVPDTLQSNSKDKKNQILTTFDSVQSSFKSECNEKIKQIGLGRQDYKPGP